MGGLKRGRPPGRKGRCAAAGRGRLVVRVVALVAASSSSPRRCARPPRRSRRRPERLVGIVAALAEVLRLDVADVQEAVAAHAEIDEGRLDARLQVDDDPLVDVAHVAVLAGALDVELFQDAVFDDRDPAFLRLRDVDQHFLFHGLAFLWQDRRAGIRVGKRVGDVAARPHGSISTSVRVRRTPWCFEVVQAQGGQHVARPGAAAGLGPQPHLPARRPAAPAQGARRGGRPALDVGRRIGQVAAASNRWMRSSRPAQPRRREAATRSGARRRRALRLPGGRTSDRLDAQPRRGLRPESSQQFIGGSGSVSSSSMTSSLPSMPTAKARGNVIRGLGETPRSCPAPARRGEIAAPGSASGPGGRSGAAPTAWKIECVLAVEPLVRINLLRQDKSGGKLCCSYSASSAELGVESLRAYARLAVLAVTTF